METWMYRRKTKSIRNRINQGKIILKKCKMPALKAK